MADWAIVDAQAGAAVSTNPVTIGGAGGLAILAGDVVVFGVSTNDAVGTATIGAVAGIVADVSQGDPTPTRRASQFSKVITAADLAVNGNNGTISCTASSYGTGGGRHLFAAALRHPDGAGAVVFRNGGESTNTTGTTDTLTEAAVPEPCFVFIVVNIGTTASNLSAAFDGGTAHSSDYPGNTTGQSVFFLKPNVAGTEVSYGLNVSRTQEQVVLSGFTSGQARAITMGVYAAANKSRPKWRATGGAAARQTIGNVVVSHPTFRAAAASVSRQPSKTNTVAVNTVRSMFRSSAAAISRQTARTAVTARSAFRAAAAATFRTVVRTDHATVNVGQRRAAAITTAALTTRSKIMVRATGAAKSRALPRSPNHLHETFRAASAARSNAATPATIGHAHDTWRSTAVARSTDASPRSGNRVHDTFRAAGAATGLGSIATGTALPISVRALAATTGRYVPKTNTIPIVTVHSTFRTTAAARGLKVTTVEQAQNWSWTAGPTLIAWSASGASPAWDAGLTSIDLADADTVLTP